MLAQAGMAHVPSMLGFVFVLSFSDSESLFFLVLSSSLCPVDYFQLLISELAVDALLVRHKEEKCRKGTPWTALLSSVISQSQAWTPECSEHRVNRPLPSVIASKQAVVAISWRNVQVELLEMSGAKQGRLNGH